MKTIIAGSRGIEDYDLIASAVEASGFDVTEVVSGCARGVDSLAIRYAKEKGIPAKLFPADWNTHGRGAGFIRNTAMADYADALIAVWDGKSRGTSHMVYTATKKGLKVYKHVLS